MASLVAEYGDDSSSCDSDNESHRDTYNESNSRKNQEKQHNLALSFFTDTGKNSSDDSDTESSKNLCNGESSEVKGQKLPSPFQLTPGRLPAPSLGTQVSEGNKISSEVIVSSSVFVNPYEQAEQAKLGILEKHVRLTEAAPQKPATRQTCWKFKKGRCHLGDRCRFFHDMSNISLGGFQNNSWQNSQAQGVSKIPTEADQVGAVCGQQQSAFQSVGYRGESHYSGAHVCVGQSADTQSMDDDKGSVSFAKKKKRHGVTDTLLPPKKALASLNKMRQLEHPWTMKK